MVEPQKCEWCGVEDVPALYYETIDPPDLDGNDVVWVCAGCRPGEERTPMSGKEKLLEFGRNVQQVRIALQQIEDMALGVCEEPSDPSPDDERDQEPELRRLERGEGEVRQNPVLPIEYAREKLVEDGG